MAFEKPLLMHSFKAASDMSASTQQFILVKIAAEGLCCPCTAASDIPIGVLQNLPARNETAEVMINGISKLRAGGTDLAVGALIGTDTTSRAVAYVAGGTGTASYIVGKVLSIDAADNDGALVTATVSCLSATRGV